MITLARDDITLMFCLRLYSSVVASAWSETKKEVERKSSCLGYGKIQHVHVVSQVLLIVWIVNYYKALACDSINTSRIQVMALYSDNLDLIF